MCMKMPSRIAPTSRSSATDPSKTYLPHYQTPLKIAPEWGIFLLGKFNDIRMLCLPSAMHYYPDFLAILPFAGSVTKYTIRQNFWKN